MNIEELLKDRAPVFPQQHIQRRADEIALSLIQQNPTIKTKPQDFLAMAVLQGGLPWSLYITGALETHGVTTDSHPLKIQGRYQTGTTGKGEIAVLDGPSPENIKGRTILLLDDVIDEGNTLEQIIRYLENLGKCAPAQVIISALCEKTAFREVDLPYDESFIGVKYEGTDWLVGGGMDINGQGRDLGNIYGVSAEEAQLFIR
jgi:hypoxanthine phosphoribosyltransferase